MVILSKIHVNISNFELMNIILVRIGELPAVAVSMKVTYWFIRYSDTDSGGNQDFISRMNIQLFVMF